jgi:HEAT repeat protein
MAEKHASEQTTSELNKLMQIASDSDLSADIRSRAIKSMGSIGSHDALLYLLEIVANDGLSTKERELALKQAQSIVKRGR